jgi:hypothetical protein
MVMLTPIVRPTVTSTSLTVVAAKPLASAETLYGPGGNNNIAYNPSSFEVDERARPVCLFVAVTVAFEMAAP